MACRGARDTCFGAGDVGEGSKAVNALSAANRVLAHGDATTLLAQAAQDGGLTLADIYILIASSILFIPAFFALLHVVRGRGVVLAHIAGILGLAGVSLGLTRAGFQLLIWTMAPCVGCAAGRTTSAGIVS